MSRESEHNVYVRNLSEKRKGYPLYHPAPSDDLPPEYRSEGVEIGDVGHITVDGVFDPLFNIFKPSSHPINVYGGVPDGFQPLSLMAASCRRHATRHPRNTQYSNKALKSKKLSANAGADIPGLPLGAQCGFSYESSSSEGACLILPDGANFIDVRALDPISRYAEKNAEAWFNYAAQRGIAVEDLYLITGVDKARSWAMASYSYSSSKTSVEFQFTACTMANAGASAEYSWRHNPDHPLITKVSEPNELINQAIFLRGFSISQRRSRMTLKARVKVKLLEGCDEGYYLPIARRGMLGRSSSISNLPDLPASALTSSSSRLLEQLVCSLSDGYPDDSSNSSVSDPELTNSPAQVYHPGQILNHYLLRRSNDDVHFVITHDSDWCKLNIELATELFSEDHSVVDTALSSAIEGHFAVISDRGIVRLKSSTPASDNQDQGGLVSLSDVVFPSHGQSPEEVSNVTISSLPHSVEEVSIPANDQARGAVISLSEIAAPSHRRSPEPNDTSSQVLHDAEEVSDEEDTEDSYDTYRWGRAPFGRTTSVPYEHSVFGSRRPSQSVDDDWPAYNPQPAAAIELLAPHTGSPSSAPTPGDWSAFGDKGQGHLANVNVSTTSTLRVDGPRGLSRPDGFDEEWRDMLTGIIALNPTGDFMELHDTGPSISGPSATSSMTLDAVGGWNDADGYGDLRRAWTFKRELDDGSGPVHRKSSPSSKLGSVRASKVGEMDRLSLNLNRTALGAEEKEKIEHAKEKERRSPANWKGMAPGAREVWGNSLIGRYTVNRTSRDPVDSNKGPQHRLSINHFRDSSTRLRHKSPPSTIHRHSKAQAFSIGRFYRHKPPTTPLGSDNDSSYSRPSTRDGSSRPGASRESSYSNKPPSRDSLFAKSSTPQDSTARKTDVKGSNLVLLAPWRVQQEYTAANTTKKLESRGLLEDNNREVSRPQPDKSRQQRRQTKSDIGQRTDSQIDAITREVSVTRRRRPNRRTSLSSDDDEDRVSHKTPHNEMYSSVDPSLVELLRPPVHVVRNSPDERGILGVLRSRSARPVPTAAQYDPPWMVMANRNTQEHHQQIVKNLNSSFTGIGLLPAPGRDRVRAPKAKPLGGSTFEQIPHDSMLMLLPLWPGDTDSTSHSIPFTRPTIPIERRLFLLVFYTVKDIPPRPESARKGKPTPGEKWSRASSSQSGGELGGDIVILLPNYHISACVLTYNDLRGINMRLPEEGIAVGGPLEEAYATIPRYQNNGIQMMANCASHESGVEFDPQGLDRLGLCVTDGEGHFIPTPIGRAVMEMAWLGGMALTSFGSITS